MREAGLPRGIRPQQNQAAWVDLYVPKTAGPGNYRGTITISTPALKEPAILNLALAVRPLALPDEITWPVELNTYGEVCGSERLTGAILDRLTRRVHILAANGESYRLRDSRRRLKARKA